MAGNWVSRLIHYNAKYTLTLSVSIPTVHYREWKGSYTYDIGLFAMLKLARNRTGSGTPVSFKMTSKNINRVVKSLNKAYSWFFDKSLPDLYVLDDKGVTRFNADYKHLHVTVRGSKEDLLRIIPVEIEAMDKVEEGVYLQINTTENIIPLTVTELCDLISILSEIRFEEQITMLLYIYNTTPKEDRIPSDRFMEKERND
jgi:hypothetical protein